MKERNAEGQMMVGFAKRIKMTVLYFRKEEHRRLEEGAYVTHGYFIANCILFLF